MSYPAPRRLQLPVEPYNAAGYAFGQRVRRFGVWWAVHLGDDAVAPAGTVVRAIGKGEVVFAKVLPGSVSHRSWGGLVVIGHSTSPYALSSHEERGDPAADGVGEVFYSLYGHLAKLSVAVGDTVSAGQEVGAVAEGNTPENGWWKTPHLHFGIYTGPWSDAALPGYWRPERWWRTKRRWWHDPREFIASYNRASKLVNM